MAAAEGPAGSSVDCGPPHAATDSAAASAGAAVLQRKRGLLAMMSSSRNWRRTARPWPGQTRGRVASRRECRRGPRLLRENGGRGGMGRNGAARPMLLMIDNYDSFTFNLVQYCRAGRRGRGGAQDALTWRRSRAARRAHRDFPGPCTQRGRSALEVIERTGRDHADLASAWAPGTWARPMAGAWCARGRSCTARHRRSGTPERCVRGLPDASRPRDTIPGGGAGQPAGLPRGHGWAMATTAAARR